MRIIENTPTYPLFPLPVSLLYHAIVKSDTEKLHLSLMHAWVSSL